MRLFHRVFVTFLGSLPVRPNSLGRGASMLRIYLSEKGSPLAESLPEAACTRLIQEAYRRAAEAGRSPRLGKFYIEIDAIADEIIAAVDRSPSANSRVKTILELNKVL